MVTAVLLAVRVALVAVQVDMLVVVLEELQLLDKVLLEAMQQATVLAMAAVVVLVQLALMVLILGKVKAEMVVQVQQIQSLVHL
jgi:hypothetical protein